MRERLSRLSTRITLAMIGLAIATALIVAWWTQRQIVSAALPGDLRRIESHARQLASRLDAHVEAARAEALVLARSPLVIEAVTHHPTHHPTHRPTHDPAKRSAIHEAWTRRRDHLEGHFRAILRAKPWLLQLRVIDADEAGRELVRVDRAGPDRAIRTVPDHDLQEKGERDYIRIGRTLDAGALHISPLELNQEYGEFERPFRPVVRTVTPVWDERTDRATALLVINVDMATILESLSSGHYPGSLVYVVDGNGDYWRNPTDPAVQFLSASGSQQRADWRDEFPGLVEESANQPTSAVLSRHGEELAASAMRTSLEPGVHIIETAPYEEVVSFTDQTARATISITALVLVGALLLALVVSISLVRPLRQLTRAVENFGTADLSAARLPRHGEFGVLATTLQRLAVEVEERTRSLQDEVASHKVTAAEWRAAEERMRLVMEACPSGICVVDADGLIVLVNQAVETLLGYSRDQLIGSSVDDLVPEDVRSTHAAYRRAFMDDPSHRPMGSSRDLFAQHANGHRVAVEIGLCPLTLQGRDTVLVSIVDITERRAQHQKLAAYAAQLERGNAELEQLAYVVSHDIKAPLRGIATVAQWISTDFAPFADDDARENLDLMRERVERLDRLLEGILEYSRAARGEYPRRQLESAALVRDVIASLAPPARIDVRVAEPLPTVHYNEAQLRQIFQNLIDNAMTYLGKPEGTIVVSCEEREDEWEFAVCDDGQGIPAQHLERIFELFRTLQPRSTSKSTGAGLAIVKRIVESNGGQVRVESTEGTGTTFYFTVPRDPA